MNGTLLSQKCFSDEQTSLMADLDKFINHVSQFFFPIFITQIYIYIYK
uniref:Uncharacterized protein n=1 Tax=Heterorhabditis bacteriophora TaxID=37862 RepID=A0A1I7WUD9_HETBA